MSLKKDKQKVLGEHFDDERVKSFLDFQAYDNVSADFCVLEKAYRGMNPENFATFVDFFKAAGRDINCLGPNEKTFLATILEHRYAQEYITPLKRAGAV